MGVQNVERLSIGQWLAMVEGWIAAHADKPRAPSDDEFEAALSAAKGMGL